MTKKKAKEIVKIVEEALREVYSLMPTPTKKQKEFFDKCLEKLEKSEIK